MAVAAAVACAASGWLPWAASGRRHRSSYALARVARELGLHAGVSRLSPAWLFAPVLASGVVLAFALGYRRLAASGALVVGATGLVVAIAVRTSRLRPLPGTNVGLAAAVIAVGAAAAALCAPASPALPILRQETS